jgi:hypothetical protein
VEKLKVGQQTELFKMKVTESDAVKFAEVIHDMPLAKEAGQSIVPATYPIVYWQKVEIPWLKDIGPLVHGEQSFHYKDPLLTDHTYYAEIKLVDIKEKTGKSGKIVWLVHEMYGYQDALKKQPVFTGITTAMFRPEQEGET